MTQNEKDLLLKDLCARLPYGVKVEYNGGRYDVLSIAHERVVLCKPFSSITEKDCPLIKDVKPYLLPLSSMTEEQKTELDNIKAKGIDAFEELWEFYHKNHLDFRGLIELGLAFDATNLNIY